MRNARNFASEAEVSDNEYMHLSRSTFPDVVSIKRTLTRPEVVVRPPGSKSLTNRALLCASLATGRSELRGVLLAEDSWAMVDAVTLMGAETSVNETDCVATVKGVTGSEHHHPPRIDARQSGTTSRFILPVLALGTAKTIIDGDSQLRSRPFEPLFNALRSIGGQIENLAEPGQLPVSVSGPAKGGKLQIAGHLSSQFVSGLLIAGAMMPDGLEVELTSPLVSEPYVEMTRAVMAAFGAEISGLTVRNSGYVATTYEVEPDATAASYMLAAAAITGGQITIEGLGSSSIQGDVGFVKVLEMMGAKIIQEPTRTMLTGPEQLAGVDVDLSNMSDTAQTLAAVAVFATSPTRVRGIGFIRHKESNRILAMVEELGRAGIRAQEDPDGFTIYPGQPHPTRFATYDDHRMAMSLSLLGLQVPGVEISGPNCVLKTYPRFFEDLSLFSSSNQSKGDG